MELGRGPKSLWSGWRLNDAFDTVAINNFAIDNFAIYNLAIARLGSVAGHFVGHSDEAKVFAMRDDAFALVPGVLVVFHLLVPVGHAPFLLLFGRRQWTCRRRRGWRGRRADLNDHLLARLPGSDKRARSGFRSAWADRATAGGRETTPIASLGWLSIRVVSSVRYGVRRRRRRRRMSRVEYILDVLPFEDGSLGLILELQTFSLELVNGVAEPSILLFEGLS